ncbi:MAG TPA: methyl-accepting chemotaxis protein [Acetobacteraceae bacterium]|nr:methyl-accepting chemotaxis protein [Acetobacteraceae bacterium]
MVAAEVKNLAHQTARATEEVGAQVAGVQGATVDAVEAVRHVAGTIEDIDQIARAIATAVEQRALPWRRSPENTRDATARTREVAGVIGEVTRGAQATGRSADQVLHSADGVLRRSEQLGDQVRSFLAGVRAA